MFDDFIAQLRCPACGAMSGPNDYIAMQTHLNADGSSLAVGYEFGAFELTTERIVGRGYALVTTPRSGEAIRLLEGWTCPACQTEQCAVVTIEDNRIQAIEPIAREAALRAVNFVSDALDFLPASGAMNRIEQVFGVKYVLLPVIHPVGREEALASIRVVVAAGVKGVFLIDQGMSEGELLPFLLEVRALHPALWIGINLLSRRPADALATALAGCEGSIDGIWSDNAGIDEHVDAQPRAEEFVTARRKHGWNGLYFGGTAFKYQREVAAGDLGRVAALAARYMDVVCTSGPGTGQAADVAKLRAMREGLGDAAISLASGVTAENVHEYLPYVNAYLVGTGIESRLGVIDAAKVNALVRAMVA